MADLLETCIDDVIRAPEAVPMATEMEEAGPSGAHAASSSSGVAVDDGLGQTGEGGGGGVCVCVCMCVWFYLSLYKPQYQLSTCRPS